MAETRTYMTTPRTRPASTPIRGRSERASPLNADPRVSTFHSVCVRLLRRDGDPLASIRPGFTRQFTIYDDDDQLAIIKATYKRLGLDEKEFMKYRGALSRLSHSKNLK